MSGETHGLFRDQPPRFHGSMSRTGEEGSRDSQIPPPPSNQKHVIVRPEDPASLVLVEAAGEPKDTGSVTRLHVESLALDFLGVARQMLLEHKLQILNIEKLLRLKVIQSFL